MAASVAGQFVGDWQQALAMPGDDGIQCLHDMQAPYPIICQRRLRGVAQTEPAHHHVQFGSIDRSEPQVGERDLCHCEQRRHQELVAELDLEKLHVERRIVTSAEANLAHGSDVVIEFFEQ